MAATAQDDRIRAHAQAKWVRTSARKARLVLDHIRGRSVPEARTVLAFTTRDGRAVQAVEQVKTGKQQPPVGARVAIHYDRNDPTSVVTDTSHTARDVTLWIVAVKLFVGGIVLVVVGTRRLRRERTGNPSDKEARQRMQSSV